MSQRPYVILTPRDLITSIARLRNLSAKPKNMKARSWQKWDNQETETVSRKITLPGPAGRTRFHDLHFSLDRVIIVRPNQTELVPQLVHRHTWKKKPMRKALTYVWTGKNTILQFLPSFQYSFTIKLTSFRSDNCVDTPDFVCHFPRAFEVPSVLPGGGHASVLRLRAILYLQRREQMLRNAFLTWHGSHNWKKGWRHRYGKILKMRWRDWHHLAQERANGWKYIFFFHLKLYTTSHWKLENLL